ncbi:EAL domain-containing protein [Nocardioides anomalus]|uniref:EAL domain-containing protein n=1 Tax=Nocardioides anomalus TaxID=2712223 RepID=A0A6G6WH88_9ACTN|nr:EAL domain-containing protein [Nocardioides anomalus]QIG44513.1 EAL domain-containing protein [Nocardioides anomalus]
MPDTRTRLRDSRSWRFDVGLCVLGVALLVWATPHALGGGWEVLAAVLVGVPVVVLVAHFPMVLDGEDGGIEIGFDSTVLMFLLCTLDARSALAVWGLGVIATQVTSGKRPTAIVFNVGVGVLAGAVSAAALHLVRGGQTGTPRELLAMVAAASAYFSIDYVLSAISVGIDSGTPIRSHLVQPGTWLAVVCFVPFDLLGYLAAVVLRSNPWWMLSLLVVPLITLLVATRALTRGRENARRLTVLLEAAVRIQSVHESELVSEAVLHDARRLIRLTDVEVRTTPPAAYEIGAQVRRGKDALWIVAQSRERARATVQADQHALDALAVLATDAFARLQLTADMVHFARHDPLTDLPNRGILLDRVAHALHLARRRNVRVALLFVDLDEFKPVNDRFGHAAGDEVLIEVARRLLAATRESDTVARLGGDEFAVLLEDVSVQEVIEISDRILASLMRGAEVSGHHVPLGASIGIAYGDGSESGEALLREADLAMYEAKGRGKAQSVSYEPAIGRASIERLELVEELRRAIDEEELAVVYQPVVATESGLITGVEALVRWRLNGTDVPTDVFVRIAEDTGLVVGLGELVLRRVSGDARALRDAAGGPISISVNVSARQLRDPRFVGVVQTAVRDMDRTGLVLEITERQEIGDDPEVLHVMRVIAAMGVRFAIDDFGVGFSSISYLHELPAHVVKTDATLSAGIDHDERARAVLHAIAVMGDALGLDVVVEGVERETQLEAIREEVGAPFVQGYLLHRPMPLEALLPVVRDNRHPDARPKVEELPAPTAR